MESVPGISGNIASFITEVGIPGRFLESNSYLWIQKELHPTMERRGRTKRIGGIGSRKGWRGPRSAGDVFHRILIAYPSGGKERMKLSLSPILSPVQVRRGSVQSAVGDDIHSSSMNLSPTPISV